MKTPSRGGGGKNLLAERLASTAASSSRVAIGGVAIQFSLVFAHYQTSPCGIIVVSGLPHCVRNDGSKKTLPVKQNLFLDL